MAIFAGLAVPVASSMINLSARRATATELESMGTSVVEYFRDTGVLPTQAVNLMVDPSVAGWSGPYILLDAAEPVRGQPDGGLDAWRNAYAFSVTGVSTLQISSAGSDQFNGTSDDLIFTVDVTPVRREMTLEELITINQAILQYNAANLPSLLLSTTHSTLLSRLIIGGAFLTTGATRRVAGVMPIAPTLLALPLLFVLPR